MSLYEFHVVKIQNLEDSEERMSSELSTKQAGY